MFCLQVACYVSSTWTGYHPCHLVWANHSLPRLLSPYVKSSLLEGPSDFPLLLTHKNIIPFFLHLSASVFSCYIPYHNTDVLRQQPHAGSFGIEQYLLNDEFIKSGLMNWCLFHDSQKWFPFLIYCFQET